MKVIAFCLAVICSGCGLYIKIVHVDLNTQPISKDKVTVIFYSDERFLPTFEIYSKKTKTKLGELTSVKPLKIQIEAGEYDFYADMPDGMAIRRIFNTHLKNGETRIFRVYIKVGIGVSSFVIEEVKNIKSYDTDVGWKG